ncbi:hypothetical protein H5410_043771 [Solanum commersonii]|uniref:Uncharacterized protein n=1 Tax=Solanum commersonii TaxID=4109 RepID=A0A9J5XYH8_SOLCO|nr:hypothetical protein H5410_043771 [Solanum commersonii]
MAFEEVSGKKGKQKQEKSLEWSSTQPTKPTANSNYNQIQRQIQNNPQSPRQQKITTKAIDTQEHQSSEEEEEAKKIPKRENEKIEKALYDCVIIQDKEQQVTCSITTPEETILLILDSLVTYTWCNGEEKEKNLERLDRVLINLEWSLSMLIPRSPVLSEFGSIRSLDFYILFSSNSSKYFRFLDLWTQEHGFNETNEGTE